MTRALLLILPALALIIWGVAAQLPRWTAPQPNWFAASTPAVCAAVDSLRINDMKHGEPPDGIGREAAQARAAEIVAEHYSVSASGISEPLGVYLNWESALQPAERLWFYLVTAQLGDAAAVMYIEAKSGEARILITSPDDETVDCEFDTRAALVAAVRSPATILFGAYILLTAGALVARRLLQAKGKRP